MRRVILGIVCIGAFVGLVGDIGNRVVPILLAGIGLIVWAIWSSVRTDNLRREKERKENYALSEKQAAEKERQRQEQARLAALPNDVCTNCGRAYPGAKGYKRCRWCGSELISKCPGCKAALPKCSWEKVREYRSVFAADRRHKRCTDCGTEFPWWENYLASYSAIKNKTS